MSQLDVSICRNGETHPIHHGTLHIDGTKRVYTGAGALIDYFYNQTSGAFFISKESFERCNTDEFVINGNVRLIKDCSPCYNELEIYRRDHNGS